MGGIFRWLSPCHTSSLFSLHNNYMVLLILSPGLQYYNLVSLLSIYQFLILSLSLSFLFSFFLQINPKFKEMCVCVFRHFSSSYLRFFTAIKFLRATPFCGPFFSEGSVHNSEESRVKFDQNLWDFSPLKIKKLLEPLDQIIMMENFQILRKICFWKNNVHLDIRNFTKQHSYQ